MGTSTGKRISIENILCTKLAFSVGRTVSVTLPSSLYVACPPQDQHLQPDFALKMPLARTIVA